MDQPKIVYIMDGGFVIIQHIVDFWLFSILVNGETDDS